MGAARGRGSGRCCTPILGSPWQGGSGGDPGWSCVRPRGPGLPRHLGWRHMECGRKRSRHGAPRLESHDDNPLEQDQPCPLGIVHPDRRGQRGRVPRIHVHGRCRRTAYDFGGSAPLWELGGMPGGLSTPVLRHGSEHMAPGPPATFYRCAVGGFGPLLPVPRRERRQSPNRPFTPCRSGNLRGRPAA